MSMTVRNRTGRVKMAPAGGREATKNGRPLGQGGAQGKPLFSRCDMVGPDGVERPGWELWVGGRFFGRAESKAVLLEYYARAQFPFPSTTWTESSWYVPRARGARSSPREAVEDVADAWE